MHHCRGALQVNALRQGIAAQRDHPPLPTLRIESLLQRLVLPLLAPYPKQNLDTVVAMRPRHKVLKMT